MNRYIIVNRKNIAYAEQTSCEVIAESKEQAIERYNNGFVENKKVQKIYHPVSSSNESIEIVSEEKEPPNLLDTLSD